MQNQLIANVGLFGRSVNVNSKCLFSDGLSILDKKEIYRLHENNLRIDSAGKSSLPGMN